jgi:exonuclease VII small subunit
MNEKSADTLEQVIKFAPKGRPSPYDTPVEEAGQAIVAKIQKAAELANEDYDRAMRVAHKLSMQLRAAEDQINQLQAENELFRDRATRAERWLQTIQKEIEEKLITARSGSSTNQTSLP